MGTTVRVITLGTAGGPRTWAAGSQGTRAGISTAVVVDGRTYLFDVGLGATRRLQQAGLTLDSLRGVFLTHLHSDHVADLAPLLMYAFIGISDTEREAIQIVGPADRGVLPPASIHATDQPRPEFDDTPTSGTVAMFEYLRRAFSADITDRVFDGLRKPPGHFFTARDIEVPPECGFHPNDAHCPDMEPFEVYADDLVSVKAILVQHHPIAPAFGFRLDAGGVSVTISGDTGPCDNLVRLAAGTDLLLHEAIDIDSILSVYAQDRMETAEAMRDHHLRAHTTPQQAAHLAARAGAKALALHHLVPGDADFGPLIPTQGFDGPIHVPGDLAVFELTGDGAPIE